MKRRRHVQTLDPVTREIIRGALRAATQLVPRGATIEVFELDGIPGFNQDEEQNPPAKVVELKRRIREADAILIVTPESTRYPEF